MSNVTLLAIVVVILSSGQMLFKAAASRLPDLTGLESAWRYATEPRLVAALVLYGAGTILWIMALRRMPLSSAYPFIALTFILTPLLASVFLGERLNWANAAGAALILAGVYVVGRWSAP